MNITFITGNAAKAEQLGRHLGVPVEHRRVDLDEIQSLDLAEVVEHKAREAYKIVGAPVLIEDVSLVFGALGRLPGPLIKWFLKELGNEGLCKLMDAYSDRSCTAEVLFGLYDGQTLRTFHGLAHGKVADRPRGEQGFGWDPIFIPEGHDQTWAEMSHEQQAKTSMRRIALDKLEAELSGN